MLGTIGCSQTNKTPSSDEAKKADPMQYFMNKVNTTNDMVICLGNGSLNYATVYYYKKIDSTLRGNIAIETLTAIEILGYDAAIVIPAFPQEGRITVGGFHLLKGTPIATALRG